MKDNTTFLKLLHDEEVHVAMREAYNTLVNDDSFRLRFKSVRPSVDFPRTFAAKQRKCIKLALFDHGFEGVLVDCTVLAAYAREQVRRELCSKWSMPKAPDDSACARLPDIAFLEHPMPATYTVIDPVDPYSQPKETTMPAIKIETRTFVNGEDISKWDNSRIYELISMQETEIERLKDIQHKPKRLELEIAEREAGIEALVAHLDGK